jgi:hypothetical protein
MVFGDDGVLDVKRCATLETIFLEVNILRCEWLELDRYQALP